MFERFNGNVVPFADESTSTNRTVFGSETQSDDIDDNLNSDFKKGWEIVGLNDNPTREDFNAMGYTLGYLTSYLYQNGVAEYSSLQEYKTNSVAIGDNGNIYQSLVDNNIGNALTDTTKWVCIASKNSIVNSIVELKTISNIESINVLGYYEKGDGGGGTFYWDATSTEADNGGTIIQATGVVTGRWKRVFSGAVNVKWFGAKGDGATDDTVAIQSALFFARDSDYGANVFLPDGKYYISQTLVIESKTQSEFYNRVNIEGSSSVNCTIIYNGNENAIVVRNYYSSSYLIKVHIKSIGITKTTNLYTGIGLSSRLSAWFEMSDIIIENFETGYELKNSLGATLIKCWFRYNKYGMTANQTTTLPPNAVNLYDCIIAGNKDVGILVSNAVQFNMFGGDVEGNGHSSSYSRSGGISISKTENTQIILNFTGVYFEANAKYADVSFFNGNYASNNNINFNGCSFVRFGVDNNKFSTNCIKIDCGTNTSSTTSLNVNGCVFSDVGGFVENSSLKYISMTLNGGIFKFNDYNTNYTFLSQKMFLNYYKDDYDVQPKALCMFNGSDTSLYKQYNISSIQKIGTGHYKIWYSEFVDTWSIPSFSTYTAGAVCNIWVASRQYIEFECLNNSNVPVDAIITVTVF